MITLLLAAAAAAAPAGYNEVQPLDLTQALHTKTPWSASLLQPADDPDGTGQRAARVCLTGGRDQKTACTDLMANAYVLQTIDDAEVETLSARTGRSALVVRAHFSGGSHELRQTMAFTYNGAGLADDVSQTAAFDRGDLGEERLFAQGPLDGLYVVADARIRGQETRWDDHRYSISVYRLTPYGGYDQVLQYVTAPSYPSEREDPRFVIDHELPRLKGLLAATYPKGLP